MSDRFAESYGPWAVVAGASEGLGQAFALELARRGLSLVLVARRRERLEELGSRIHKEMGVDVRAVALDLSEADAPGRLAEETSSLDIGLLVYNAAASTIGPFLETDARIHHRILQVNAVTSTLLCHAMGRRMADRGRGGIVLMTSLSAFQGSPLISTYAATKAYLLSFAEALSFEVRDAGVDVLACAAGATRTPNYVASNPRNTGVFRAPEQEADIVVREALKALGRKPVVITGRQNRFSHLILHRLLPRRIAVAVMGRAMNRLYGRRG